jgi:phosphoesterase RecJ-like protein
MARERIRRILEAEDRFLVAAHYNPDGDALGSMAAVGFLLRAMGKDFRLYNASGAPREFDWLALPGPVHRSLDELCDFTFSRALVLDCGDKDRMGPELAQALPRETIVNIDHHLGNEGFGAVNWVDSGFAAVGEMTALMARDQGVALSGPLGEAVYLAVVSDTGYFSYGNTSPATLELAAEIVRLGLEPGAFGVKYLNQFTMNRLKLWSEVLGQAQLFCGGRIGVLRIPAELLERTGTTVSDCDGLVNWVRRVRGVDVAMILREDGPGRIKFSLRSVGMANVQELAAQFGGGGHRNASGGSIEGDMDQAQEALLRGAGGMLGLDGRCTEPFASAREAAE